MINYFLDRTKKPKIRKPIRKVSKRRAKANAEYTSRRKAFLEAHPYCQWWIMENMLEDVAAFGFNVVEEYVKRCNGLVKVKLKESEIVVFAQVPKSTQIHHRKKPKCKYLNDESTWMAVGDIGHILIETDKKLAREKGYLENN